MTPIAKIPTELLAEIFDAYADQYRPCESHWHPRNKYNDLRRLMHVPTDLAAVCQDWKNVAFSTPSLWRILLLQSPNDADEIEEVEKRIQRSGDLTLSLYVCEINSLSNEYESRPLESFIDRHSHRWYHIQLDLEIYSYSHPLGFYLGQSGQTFTFLHRLALGATFSPESDRPTLEATTEKFPRLTSLALSQLDVYTIQAPWNQLTTLDLHQVDLPETIFALNNSLRLVHLRIINLMRQVTNRSIPFLTDPLVLPQLQTLDIMCRDPSMDPRLLLAHIQAPNLKRLRCHTANGAPCPWTAGSTGDAIRVLIPSPETSCPELIIVAETSPRDTEDVNEDPTFNFEFVQTHVPYSHILHIRSFPEALGWIYTRDGIPHLWDDLSHLCRLCLLHERGNENDGDALRVRRVRHPEGISFYPPKLRHMATACALCQFHNTT